MWKIIWIDLWTTNSCISFMEWWEAKIINNAEWNRTTPSIVAFKDWNLLVWTPAKRQAITNPVWTIFSAKRFIWRKFDAVSEEIKNVPFKVIKWTDWSALIEFNWKQVRPEEIWSHVLAKLKEDAEKYLWTKITEAVITVPAYFNDSQRQATINAWKIAWLEVKRIVNEPTAAALAYWANKQKKNEKIAVYDLWGGTFDISVLELWEEWTFEVLATNWDTHLGWDDFDKRIVDYIVDEFMKEQAVDLRKDPMALQRIRDEAHRFAITYHRTLRDKKITSVLDQIEGVGPKKRIELLKHFKSIKNLKVASVEEIAKVKGINKDLAIKILQFLQG